MTRNRLGTAVLSSIVAAFVVAALAPTTWPQTPEVDPQALIGQWSGSWILVNDVNTTGKYYLTIERVEGAKVFGQGEFSGRRTIPFKVNGTLSGNRLTYGKAELTIHGNQMTGTAPDIKITLTKEK